MYYYSQMRFINPPFRSEEEASQFLDQMRWGKDVTCPSCGNADRAFYGMAHARGVGSQRSPEGKIRFGLRKCSVCRLEFRCTYGTPFHGMKVPLDVLLAAIVHLNNPYAIWSITDLSKELGVKRDTVTRLVAAVRANSTLKVRRGIDQRELTLEPWPAAVVDNLMASK